VRQHLIAPSLLAADFTRLQDDISMVNRSEADWFHLDVMDGRFVPNITFGMFIVEAIGKMAEKPLDVHLMIVEPEKYIEAFRQAGAAVITVHYEACTHLHRVVHQIKDAGAKAGVALNPHTPVDCLSDLIEDLDLVCLMSVNPGFGGQKFIENTYRKVSEAKELLLKHNSKALIEVDGGVALNNTAKLVAAGADVLVAGNTVFASANPEATITELNKLASV